MIYLVYDVSGMRSVYGHCCCCCTAVLLLYDEKDQPTMCHISGVGCIQGKRVPPYAIRTGYYGEICCDCRWILSTCAAEEMVCLRERIHRLCRSPDFVDGVPHTTTTWWCEIVYRLIIDTCPKANRYTHACAHTHPRSAQ